LAPRPVRWFCVGGLGGCPSSVSLGVDCVCNPQLARQMPVHRVCAESPPVTGGLTGGDGIGNLHSVCTGAREMVGPPDRVSQKCELRHTHISAGASPAGRKGSGRVVFARCIDDPEAGHRP
jgi:hypothetical protein